MTNERKINIIYAMDNDFTCLKQRINAFLNGLPEKNAFGEKIITVAATKTQSCDVINLANALGIDKIGENKVQEFVEKFPNYPKNCDLHFIGHLQTNKLKYIVGKVKLIQSCDSIKLAKSISDFAEKNQIKQDVLLEVNIGKEVNKFGFFTENLQEAYKEILKLGNVKVCGLMTVLPKADILTLRKLCLQMRAIYDKLRMSDENITMLSMGMSRDYNIAIECGSNMLRIGTALFGERDYSRLAPDK